MEDTSVTIAPAAPSGYICTPPIPQGELTTSGTLVILSGLDTSDEGEYRCFSDDVNGIVVIELDVVASAYITSSSGNVTAAAASDVTLTCLLYTSPSPRDRTRSRMPSSA